MDAYRDNLSEVLSGLSRYDAAADRALSHVMAATGEDTVNFDRSTVGERHPGNWRDRSGNLAGAYKHEESQRGTSHVMTETNAMEYSVHVHFMDNYTVFTAFASGRVKGFLEKHLKAAARAGLI